MIGEMGEFHFKTSQTEIFWLPHIHLHDIQYLLSISRSVDFAAIDKIRLVVKSFMNSASIELELQLVETL